MKRRVERCRIGWSCAMDGSAITRRWCRQPGTPARVTKEEFPAHTKLRCWQSGDRRGAASGSTADGALLRSVHGMRLSHLRSFGQADCDGEGVVISQPRVPPVLIAGIGNILLQDDGFGPQTIARLESEYEFESDVELLDLGTPALDFIDYLVDRELVILLDALSLRRRTREVLVYDQAQLRQHVAGMRLSAHQPCLEETLFAAETASVGLKEVWLVAWWGPTSTSAPNSVRMWAAPCESACVSLRNALTARRQSPASDEALPQQAWWNEKQL